MWVACWLYVWVDMQRDLKVFELTDAIKQLGVAVHKLICHCEPNWGRADKVYNFDQPQFISCLVAE